MKRSSLTLVLGLAAVAVSAQAAAAPEPTAAPEAAAAPEAEPEKSVALDVDIGFASAYVWRGYNVFQDSKQMDQNTMLAPSFTLAFPKTGLSVGYWGAFQLNGDRKSELVDAGIGAEQDLILGYELALSEQLTGALGLTYYFYPLADKTVAGTSVPSYLEPNASVTYSTVADLGLLVAYFHGVQEEVKLTRHVYINPSVSKSFQLSESVGLEPKLGFGYKLFNDSAIKDNVYDVLLSVGVPIAATGSITATPSVNAAWTNLSDTISSTGAPEKRGFGEEYVVWGGLNLGFSVL